MKNTMHGSLRAQQRGVPPLVIDLLIKFGSREYDKHGGEIVYFDKKSIKKVEVFTGGLIGKLNEHMNIYLVRSGDQLITTGKRYKSIKRT